MLILLLCNVSRESSSERVCCVSLIVYAILKSYFARLATIGVGVGNNWRTCERGRTVTNLRFASFSGLRMRTTALIMNIQYLRKVHEVTGHELPVVTRVAGPPFLPLEILYHASFAIVHAQLAFASRA